MSSRGVQAAELWDAVQAFVASQTKANLSRIRGLLGITSPALPVALTLPALAAPNSLPMVDKNVAEWVNMNRAVHSAHTEAKLKCFRLNRLNESPLQDRHFPSYLAWVAWCREMAKVLSTRSGFAWRPRDVEMAVFTASGKGRKLSVLR